jgi:hypothetical protein
MTYVVEHDEAVERRTNCSAVRTSTGAGRAFPPQKAQPARAYFRFYAPANADFMRVSEPLLAPAAIATPSLKDEVHQASVARSKKHFNSAISL